MLIEFRPKRLPIRAFFKDEIPPSAPTVFIAWFGRKYFIWKCKALHQCVEMLSTEVERAYRLGKEDSIYAGITSHIKDRIRKMEIEVVIQSDEPAEILLAEYKLLQVGAGDPLCLNLTFEPLLPKWIPQNSVDTYLQEVKKLTRKPRKQPAKAAKAAKKAPVKSDRKTAAKSK